MDQSQEKAVLVFCKTCGSRKVQEVTKELQKLFTERTIKPNICGICQNSVEPQNDSKCAVVNIKKEVITDDDFEVINFNSHMSKTPKTATTDSKIMRDDHARATRLSTGALVQSASYVSKSGDSTEGDDSVSEKSSDSADSDGDNDDDDDDDDEDEMVVDLDKMIKEEESTAAKRPKITVRRLNITDRKHLDPELLKFLAPSDEPKMFVCNVCQDSTKQIAAFAKHVATHTNKEPILRPYRCHECRKSYEARGFRKHMNANHVTLFKCTHSKCRFTFKNKKALNGHMDFHKGVRKHACKVCGLAFLERRELGRHKANHGDESFTCEICMKSFNHIRKLRSHTRRMHMDNKHKCELCPYSCFTKEDLEKHMEMHPKTNLTCETCQHIFTSKAGFDFHLEINACIVPEEKTSADDLKMDANVAVKDESTAGGVVAMVTVKDEPKADGDAVLTEILQFLDAGLVTHMAKPTDPSRPFRCKHCNDRDFISAVWLLQHIQLSHPLEDCSVTHLYHCNKCSSKFEHRCDITKHWKTHSDHRPYVCSYENCSKAFKRKDVLTRHHETHISVGDKLKSSTLTEEDIEEVMQYLDPKLRRF
ncbi:zinc finger Y-chromosomal protein 2-like isoform X2 [Amphiura filiformis]